MTAVVLMLALTTITAQAEPQERPPVPKDSVELTVTGCVTGRVLATSDRRQPGVERGPYVGERVFRLNGKREIMNEIKKRNHHLVEVVGLVKRSALDDKGVKSGRVAVGGGSPVAGSGRIESGADNVAVMDVSAVRVLASSCRE